ncbi:hypothetical protein [Leptolyngbya phage Lbo-JY46]
MKPQTVYLPVNTDEPSLVVKEYQKEITIDLVKEVEGYFFNSEELNEYIANIIRNTLETAANKAEAETFNIRWDDTTYAKVDKQSITNTFEETYNKLKV